MAFPTVEGTNTSAETSQVTSHTVNLPSGIVSGDLLVASFVTGNASSTITWPNEGVDWIQLVESGSGFGPRRLSIAYRDADGGEGASITVTTDNNDYSAHNTYRISGHEGAPELSTGASGTGNADPDSLNPAGWGAEDTLWIAIVGGALASTFDTAPTSYTNLLSINATEAQGGTAGSARRELNAASEDPGAFNGPGGSTRWRAHTLAVRPSVGQTVGINHLASNLAVPSPDVLGIDQTVVCFHLPS